MVEREVRDTALSAAGGAAKLRGIVTIGLRKMESMKWKERSGKDEVERKKWKDE